VLLRRTKKTTPPGDRTCLTVALCGGRLTLTGNRVIGFIWLQYFSVRRQPDKLSGGLLLDRILCGGVADSMTQNTCWIPFQGYWLCARRTSLKSKMRQTYLILIFLLVLSPVVSQNVKTFSVNGYVQDRESGEKLIGCDVIDSASRTGVLTNAFGYFNIRPEGGISKILVHFIGYSDRTTNLHITKDTTIVIKLSTRHISVDEVTVVSSNAEAKLSRPQVGQMTMTNKDVKRLPVLLGEADVMCAVQILPGIQTGLLRPGCSRIGTSSKSFFVLSDSELATSYARHLAIS
jgi:hypothetical protein